MTNKPRIGQTGDNWNRGTGRKLDWKVLYEVFPHWRARIALLRARSQPFPMS